MKMTAEYMQHLLTTASWIIEQRRDGPKNFDGYLRHHLTGTVALLHVVPNV